MRKLSLFFKAFIICSLVNPANGQFRELWRLGEEDGGSGEFTQELGGSPAEPGSASQRDDDYYFAGIYPAPIGTLTENEILTDLIDISRNSLNPTGFERAVTHNSTNNRIHFNLSASEASAGAIYQFTLNLWGGGFWDGSGNGGYGTHDVDVLFNDTIIASLTEITENTSVTETINPATVGAVEGANKIEIVRTGGVNNGNISGWIQIDNALMEIDESSIACSEPICNFVADVVRVKPGSPVTLNWITADGANLSIDNDVGVVAAGAGSTIVNPTKTTTYTLSSTLNGDTTTAEVTVAVDVLLSFATDARNVGSSNPIVTLQWQVSDSPDTTVSIDQGIGDVTSLTAGGIGSIEVEVRQDTTFTITATRANSPENEIESDSISIDFEYDDYSTLWLLGVADQSVGEFNQELGGEFPAPGSATMRDDDYYFSGVYPDPIGELAEDELITDPVDQSNQSGNPIGMERSVTSGAPRTRIHFNLNTSDTTSNIDYRFQTRLQSGGWWNPNTQGNGGFGVHDVDITFNGATIYSETGITGARDIDQKFSATDVNAVSGENIVEIIRTGGASNPAAPDGNSGWIQFDFFSLEARSAGLAPIFGITDIKYNENTDLVTIKFPSRPGETFMIESTEQLDAEFWLEQAETLSAHPTDTETTFTFSSTTPKLFVRTRRN